MLDEGRRRKRCDDDEIQLESEVYSAVSDLQ